MTITLSGSNSDVLINALKLAKAIKKDTGVLLKLNDEDYGKKVDAMMAHVTNPETIRLYEKLSGKKHSINKTQKMYRGQPVLESTPPPVSDTQEIIKTVHINKTPLRVYRGAKR